MSVDRARALVGLNLALLAREPGPMLSRLVMPLVLITLMRPLYAAAFGASSGTAQAVAGMLVMFSLLGMSIVGGSILMERIWHTADRLRSSPATGLDLFAGKAVPILAMLLAQQALILAYGRLVFGLRIQALWLLAGTVGVWSVTLLCLGALLGTLAGSAAALSAMVDIGSLAVTGLGGAFVPLSLLPGWARAVAPVSPGYWAMKALRGALDGATADTLLGWLVLAVLAIGAATLAGIRLRHGWRRGSI